MTGATTDAGREQPDTPTETALDAIAALCGCPEWHYPGQLVRDVAALLAERDAALADLDRYRRAWGPLPPEQHEAVEDALAAAL